MSKRGRKPTSELPLRNTSEINTKRGRSPNQDCEECLPISKRITRLNIQSSSTQCVEDGHSQNDHHACGSGQSSPEDVSLPWQQNGQATCLPSSSHQVNNNNLNYLPCGSSQCDTIQNFAAKNSVQMYAVHHGLSKEDLDGYKPELGKTENPHYYQINSVLYRAHLEKASRQGMDMKL